jgi:hypothetical protein
VKASPQHNTLKEEAGCHPYTTIACLPAPNVLGRPAADQTEYFPAGATLGRKKTKRRNKTPTP